MSAILDIENLSKGFTLHHLEQRLEAFSAISFSVAAGEFVLLRGANGAGKSSLLRTIYRSYVPHGGAIRFRSEHGLVDLARIADIDMAHLRRTEIGFVTQFLQARPRVSAEALVAEPLRLAGQDPAEAIAAARAALTDFGVKPDLWRAYPTTFSGGEQQKVNLARALILPRKLLLLDEPTASLDAQARAALVARLAALKTQGTAMIGVFHHPADVAHLINRVVDLTPDTPLQEERADAAV